MGHDHGFKSRRNFLTLLGQATALPLMQGPMQILIESIVLGATQKARADVQGIIPRRFLHILHEGAPPRWMFDQFLTPYDSTFVANKTVGTRYSDDRKSVQYSTVSKMGINVPHMWQFDVARAGSGTRPLADLLANMLCLRGIDVANPAHAGAQAAQSIPTGASQSMSALSGDPSIDPIPAVAAGLQEFRYLSKAQKTAVSISSSGNMLETLLNPFISKDLGGFALKRDSLGPALDTAIKALNTAAESQHSGSVTLTNALSDAKEMMSQGFGNLDSIWNDLLNKYTGLIQRSLMPTAQMAGINDKAVTSDGSSVFTMNLTPVDSGFDLRSFISAKTAIPALAANFAMAEYVLIQNLSASVSISSAPLANLTVNTDAKVRQKFDEHQTGAMSSLMQNVFFNLAFGSCMLELIDRLKANSMFTETVIVSGSEFGRSPHANGYGSDHGFSGGSSMILSGALQPTPMVLGNIYLDRKQDIDDAGTWGYGAPVTELGKTLNMGHWASTIATLLRVPSPVSASGSLLVNNNGVYTPVIELAKQVAG